MKKNYGWGSSSPVKWSYTLHNNEIMFNNENCYKQMVNNADFITLYNLDCEKTIKYKMFYLNYVSEMFNLKTEITDTYFKFKAFNSINKNRMVCAVVRFLWENIGTINPPIPLHDELFEKLISGKSKYRNKLKRFCDFYSKINMGKNSNYFHEGHSWKPNKTVIKSTKDFEKYVGNECDINTFFTT